MSELRLEGLIGEIGTVLASHESLERPLRRRHSSSTDWLAEAVRKLEEAAEQAGVAADCDELAPIALSPDAQVDTEALEIGHDDALMLTREIEATIHRIRATGSELASLMARMDDLPEDVASYLDQGRTPRVLTPEEQKKVDRENRAWRRRQVWIANNPFIPIAPLLALLVVIVTALKLGAAFVPPTAAISAEEQSTDVH